MNRRQKMKRMKQELEWYKNHIVRPKTIYPRSEYDIQTYAVTRTFSAEDANILRDKGIHEYLAKDFIDMVRENMEVEVAELWSIDGSAYKYDAILRIAKPYIR